MQAMLTKGADVHLRDDQGWTSLMCCCQGAVAPRSASREACLRILLGAGAVVGCENLVGRTALHAAAASGVSHISLCEVLLAWGADATLRSSAGDSPVSCLLRSADRSGDTIPLLRRLSPLLAAAAGVQAELDTQAFRFFKLLSGVLVPAYNLGSDPAQLEAEIASRPVFHPLRHGETAQHSAAQHSSAQLSTVHHTAPHSALSGAE